jgi:glycerol-3-phosphate dehydrogenase
LIQAGVVINAAGVWSDVVASYANDRFFTIHGRKGTAAILDRKVGHTQRTILSQPRFASHSHTKGGGLVPTIDGNLLLGPTAVEVPEREDYSTNASALEFVFDHHLKLNKSLKRSDIITYFSGVRACTFEEDFVIKTSDYVANLVHAAGIQSPGLASSPAIAQDVALLAVKALAAVAGRAIQPNAAFDPCRKAPPDLRGMSLEERAALIRRNPSYGRIICRCECISEGEILNTIHSLVPVQSLDGIKRRARAGMGRCQGGFCTPLLLEIMAREQQINIAEICKSGGHSEIALQPTKNAAVDCASEGAGSAALALSAANNSRRQEDYNAG